MNLQSAEQNAEDKIKQTKYKRQKLKIRRKNTMAKRGGFPGGMPGNMTNLMKQAQRMQRQMEDAFTTGILVPAPATHPPGHPIPSIR